VGAALGLSGVAAVSTQIAYVQFIIGVVLMAIHLFRGRHSPYGLRQVGEMDADAAKDHGQSPNSKGGRP